MLYILAKPDGQITQVGNMPADEFAQFQPPGLEVYMIDRLPQGDLIGFLANYCVKDGALARRSEDA